MFVGIGLGLLDMMRGHDGIAPIVDSGPYDLAVQEEYATAGATSLAVTLRQAPTAGNLLVCHFGCKRPVANLIGPGAGWTLAVERQGSTICSAQIWYKISDGTETTITCTQDAAAATMVVVIREYAGVSASPLDVVVSNSGSGITTLNLGTTGMTAQADVLAVALLFVGDVTPRRLVSWSNDFDPVLSPALEGPRMHVADKLLSATGTVTTTPVWEASTVAAGMIAAFKLAGPPVRPAMPVRRLASGTYSTTENSGLTRASRSFTPLADRLVVCLFGVSDDGGIVGDTTIADSHGGLLNWTIIQHDLGGGVSRHVYLAYAWTSETPSADTITFTFAQTGSALWYSIVEIGGVDLSDPVPQFATAQAGGVGGTEIDITQAVAPAATSTMIGILMHGANDRHVHEAGYHIVQEGTPANLTQQTSAFWYPAGDQTAHIEWTTEIHAIAIVAEIKRAA